MLERLSEKVIIIGTSHIAKDSIKEIKETIKKEKPDIIGIELDKNRLYSLKNNITGKASISDISQIGLQGYLFTLLGGWLQKKLGNIVGIKPGSDMLAAYEAAKENNSKIELIDQDIRVTMKRFSQEFGIRDKYNIFIDLVKGLVLRQDIIRFDLSKVPPEKVIEKIIRMARQRYPGLYSSLIEERNIFMAAKIYLLAKKNPDKKIIAVVGAGHLEGIAKLLSEGPGLSNTHVKPDYSYSVTYDV